MRLRCAVLFLGEEGGGLAVEGGAGAIKVAAARLDAALRGGERALDFIKGSRHALRIRRTGLIAPAHERQWIAQCLPGGHIELEHPRRAFYYPRILSAFSGGLDVPSKFS